MTSPRIGVCLAGGGITGAMYEVGVLAALEAYFEDFVPDVVVGAASGACVATAIAGGVPAERLYRALLDPSDDFFPLERQHLLRVDLRELRRVARSAFGAFRRSAGAMTSRPLAVDLWAEVDRFFDSLPAGVLTTEAFEQFFFDVLTRRGIPKTFADMPRRLLLVANDLDVGERVVFGVGADLEHVPVAKAVSASLATPLLFAPVRIDGRDFVAGGVGEAGHVDVAVEQGCELVLVVNAMVPLRLDPASASVPTGHGQKTRVRDKGLLWVYNQAWRLVTAARLEKGLASYAAEHPKVRLELLEPDRDDATMFLHSPMNFAARRALLEDGFASTTRRLRAEASALRTHLVQAGLTPR
ncbi:MAG: patatin-like phospholipase family protein [Myxococcota bacterium]